MKVHELMEILKAENPDSEVILSRDAEGNGFEELRYVSFGSFVDGEFYDYEFTAEDHCMDEVEWASFTTDPDYANRICLWP